MRTLRLLAEKPTVPTSTAWYLSDLGEARGKQALFTRQSPQRLRALREHALIESAVSSNRIEGVTVEQSRVKAVVSGKSLLRDRDEEEIRGYRDALELFTINTRSLRFLKKQSYNSTEAVVRILAMRANTNARTATLLRSYPTAECAVDLKPFPQKRLRLPCGR